MDKEAIDGIFKELKGKGIGIIDITLTDRGGFHVAGDEQEKAKKVIKFAHAAIMLGASKALRGELKEGLEYIIINPKSGAKFMIALLGETYLLIIRIRESKDVETIKDSINKKAEDIYSHL